MTASMNCPRCGHSLSDRAETCPSCNARVGETPGGATPAGAAPGPLYAGQAFGPRYRILRPLSAGGMSAVYQARDEELGVDVALKVIRPEALADPHTALQAEQRFKHELALARQVTHRNIVRIHDMGNVGGIQYLT